MTKQLITAETSSKTEVCNSTRSWGWEPPRIVYASRVPPRPMESRRSGETEYIWYMCRTNVVAEDVFSRNREFQILRISFPELLPI